MHREKTDSWRQRKNRSNAATSYGMPRMAGDHQKLGRSKEGLFPRTLRGSMALQTPQLHTWPPELWKKQSLLFQANQFRVICYSSPRKPILRKGEDQTSGSKTEGKIQTQGSQCPLRLRNAGSRIPGMAFIMLFSHSKPFHGPTLPVDKPLILHLKFKSSTVKVLKPYASTSWTDHNTMN